MQDAFGVARRRAFMGGFRLRLGRFAHTAILTQASSVPRYARFLWGGLRVEPGDLVGRLKRVANSPDPVNKRAPSRVRTFNCAGCKYSPHPAKNFGKRIWGANLLECHNLPEEPID